MTPQQAAAIRDYKFYWLDLRMEAEKAADEARTATPLKARILRNAAARADFAAVIAHRAAWREEHPEEAEA